jgi:hypothetical protein
MRFSDAIIIYLALGSPFAVHVLMTCADRSFIPTVGWAFFNFLCWPVTLLSLVYQAAKGGLVDQSARRHTDVETELKKLLTMFESISYVGKQSVSIFEFRSIFARYTGLALAVALPIDTPTTSEIFEVSGHPSPAIASTCLSRRAGGKLSFHLDQARVEFIGSVASFAAESKRPERVAALAIEIAQAVRDGVTVIEFRKMFYTTSNSKGSFASIEEVEKIWSTPERSHSVAN